MNFTRTSALSIVLSTLLLLPNALMASLAPVQRMTVYLDDNSPLVVDNASHLSYENVYSLVLASDRSTVSGCPFSRASKGRFTGGEDGDRVIVTDNYLAWFDYSVTDGAFPEKWGRSGSLTGFWALDPKTQFFKHVHGKGGNGSPSSKPGETSSNTPCFNWPRNQLIVGSNSPAGESYWWDKYAPPVEHTIVLRRAVPRDETFFGGIDLFSTNYVQTTPGSGFRRLLDGEQRSDGIRYSTAGRLSNQAFEASFDVVDPETGAATKGYINYSLVYIAKESEVVVGWVVRPTKSVKSINTYVDLWTSYSGLGMASTCADKSQTVADVALGSPSDDAEHRYNFVQSSEPLDVYNRAGRAVRLPPQMTISFPWDEAIPCNGTINVGAFSPSNKIEHGAFISLLSSSSTIGAGLSLTNRMSPTFSIPDRPTLKPFPYVQLVVGAEQSDQQMSIMMMNSNEVLLDEGASYATIYSISDRPQLAKEILAPHNRPAAK